MQTKSLQTKRVLRTALLVLLLIVAGMGKTMAQYFDFSAVCSTGQTLYYKISDASNHYVSLTCPNNPNVNNNYINPWDGYVEPTGSIILPSSVTNNGTNYIVTEIGPYAFKDCSGLTGNLTIPNSVTGIGYHAFHGCSGFIGSLIIPNSVTGIAPSAFEDCSGFTGSLTIPNSVIDIGWSAFEDCSGFSEVFFDATLRYGFDEHHYPFSGCGGTLTIGDNVEEILPYLFYKANFTGSLTIPNSVTLIGMGAFKDCRGFTGSLTIGNSVTTISSYAFKDCSGFSEVYFNATNCQDCYGDDDYPFSGCGGTLTIGENVERIPAHIFRRTNFTGNLIIPNSVTSIGQYAFMDCSGFTGSLTIGNSVTTIGSQAFKGCSGFNNSLIIPNSVTDLGGGAFNGCSGFRGTLSIPNSVTAIYGNTFFNCSGFTGNLTIPNSVTTIGDWAFFGCSGFTGDLKFPNSVTWIGEVAFAECRGLNSVTIGNSVTHIGSGAFSGTGWYDQHPDGVIYLGNWCLGYKGVPIGSVILAGSTKGIADWAFYNCGVFPGSLTIPNSVITIGEMAFSGCGFNGLNIDMKEIPNFVFKDCDKFTGDLSIGNSVTSIGDNAFQGCSGFTGNLSIGNSVTSIGDNAFQGCSGFTGNLTIPYQVMEINDGTFSGCSGFTGTLTIPYSVNYIASNAFDSCTGLKEIYFDAIECEGRSFLSGCSGIMTIAIGDSVEIITERLFSGFENLTTVSIGKAVKIIESRAFAENPRLNMIYYNVEKDLEAATNVFDNCPNLTTIHIGPDVKEIGSEIFNGCNTVHFVVALGPTPAVLDAGAFSDIVDNSVLMVSCGKRVTYYSVWNMFPYNNIIEDCNTYSVSVGVSGTGGTVTSSAANAQMGQTVTLTVLPNPGMMLSSITVANASEPTQIIPITPGGKSASNYSFVMPPFEVVVMATFKSSGASVNENNSIEVAVYPNPTNGLVKIEAESIKHVSISNMLGQVVFDGKVVGDAFEYDFSGQKAGIYLVRIETAGGVAVKKVSVTR